MGISKAQFGMIGLGTMGRNFLLNVAEQGFSSVGYDLNAEKLELLLQEGSGYEIAAAKDIPEFLDKLARPRNIMLLVPAGPVVDSVIGELTPYLETGDLIIDGGNSHFPDTDRREEFLNEQGFEFLGVGVSGGEEGARHGASIMVGGKPDVYDRVRHRLRSRLGKGRRRALRGACRQRIGGPLCQDGPQRHRIRPDAVDRRSLRSAQTRLSYAER
jgi:6-phosphogluconate dehydrogenase